MKFAKLDELREPDSPLLTGEEHVLVERNGEAIGVYIPLCQQRFAPKCCATWESKIASISKRWV